MKLDNYNNRMRIRQLERQIPIWKENLKCATRPELRADYYVKVNELELEYFERTGVLYSDREKGSAK